MSLALAIEAVERGSCLELFYGVHCIVVDPQIAGYDHQGHPILLCVARGDDELAPLAQWLILRLDEARLVDVCGYWSEGLRPGWELSAERFATVEATSH
jgi:hypothetical protein